MMTALMAAPAAAAETGDVVAPDMLWFEDPALAAAQVEAQGTEWPVVYLGSQSIPLSENRFLELVGRPDLALEARRKVRKQTALYITAHVAGFALIGLGIGAAYEAMTVRGSDFGSDDPFAGCHTPADEWQPPVLGAVLLAAGIATWIALTDVAGRLDLRVVSGAEARQLAAEYNAGRSAGSAEPEARQRRAAPRWVSLVVTPAGAGLQGRF